MREAINELFIELCTTDVSRIDFCFCVLTDVLRDMYVYDELTVEEFNYISDSACAIIYNL